MLLRNLHCLLLGFVKALSCSVVITLAIQVCFCSEQQLVKRFPVVRLNSISEEKC